MQRELDSNLQLHEKLMAIAKDAKEHLEKNPHPEAHTLPADYHPVTHTHSAGGK